MLQYHYSFLIRLSSRLLYFPLLHFQFLRDIRLPYPLQIQSLLLPPTLQHFDYICGEGHRDLFHTCGSLCIHQVFIAVAGHQQLSSAGPHDDGYYNVLYGQGVIEYDVAPHVIPPLPSCYQLVHILYEPKRIVGTYSCMSPHTQPIEFPVLWHITYHCN